MSLYTISALTPGKKIQPCAMIEAISDEEALFLVEKFKRNGDLAFLPQRYQLTARRSSIREQEAYLDWMTLSPGNSEFVGSDDGYAQRINRLRRAFYQKLWTGVLPEHKASSDSQGSTPSSSGGIENGQKPPEQTAETTQEPKTEELPTKEELEEQPLHEALGDILGIQGTHEKVGTDFEL